MKDKLGLPIYCRINKFVHFEDFSPKTVYEITMKSGVKYLSVLRSCRLMDFIKWSALLSSPQVRMQEQLKTKYRQQLKHFYSKKYLIVKQKNKCPSLTLWCNAKSLWSTYSRGTLVRVERFERSAPWSQTLEPNFLWWFVVLSSIFRSVSNIFWRS